MRVVVAIGGNALLARGDKPDADLQLRHIHAAAAALVQLAHEHDLLICHGNGPQVGLLARESDGDPDLTRPYPLDVLGAQTQGMIGYWLTQSLRNAGLATPVVSVVSQVLVAVDDPAFASPTKFIGPDWTSDRATRLATRHGWSVARDGDAWRRVVPSPEPLRLLEQDTVDLLLSRGTTVICAGGGGVPVVDDGTGLLSGVEAVVDKDLTAAVLAVAVRADQLLILTDVPGVVRDFGTPGAAVIRHLDLDEAAALPLPAGSMRPKVEACRRFVAATGRTARIGALTDAVALLAGAVGTSISAADPAAATG